MAEATPCPGSAAPPQNAFSAVFSPMTLPRPPWRGLRGQLTPCRARQQRFKHTLSERLTGRDLRMAFTPQKPHATESVCSSDATRGRAGLPISLGAGEGAAEENPPRPSEPRVWKKKKKKRNIKVSEGISSALRRFRSRRPRECFPQKNHVRFWESEESRGESPLY